MNNNCWPDYRQELLLKSCFSSRDNSYAFWNQWLQNLKSPVDIIHEKNTLKSLFDQLDPGSQRLLPLLYRKISEINPGDPVIKSMKGYYRHCWYRNQILLQKLKNVLNQFKKHNIEIIVLKGLPLSILYYKDLGSRPMSDFDIVVKPENADLALSLLQKDGWLDLRTGKYFNKIEGLLTNSRALIDTADNELDFHWKFFKESYDTQVDNEIWTHKIPLSLEGFNAFTLNPSDQLLHTLVHGLEGNEMPSIRWIADALTIIQSEKINWDDLIEKAKKRKLAIFAYNSILYLESTFKDIIPERIKVKLEALTFSKSETRYFRQKLKLNKAGTLNWILLRHYQYRLYSTDKSYISEIMGLLIHYKMNWGIHKSIFILPVYILSHLLKIRSHPYHKIRSNSIYAAKN